MMLPFYLKPILSRFPMFSYFGVVVVVAWCKACVTLGAH